MNPILTCPSVASTVLFLVWSHTSFRSSDALVMQGIKYMRSTSAVTVDTHVQHSQNRDCLVQNKLCKACKVDQAFPLLGTTVEAGQEAFTHYSAFLPHGFSRSLPRSGSDPGKEAWEMRVAHRGIRCLSAKAKLGSFSSFQRLLIARCTGRKPSWQPT